MPLDTKRIWDACGEAFDRFTTAVDSYADNIERPVIERLSGDVAGARLLDLGCGSGTYSLRFAERGASVTGLDLSAMMIALAIRKARERGVSIDLAVADIGRPLPLAEARFDFVFTATALHYVEDLGLTMKEVARVIKPGGRLVASVLHPMSTAYFPAPGSDQWEAQYFGYRERSIQTPWLDFGDVPGEGRRILSYHHTIADYFHAITAAGLRVTDLCEPQPPPEYASKNAARYEEAMRVPVYLTFRAVAA